MFFLQYLSVSKIHKIRRDTRSGENNSTVQGYGLVVVLLHIMIFDRISNNTLQDFINSGIKLAGIITGIHQRCELPVDLMSPQIIKTDSSGTGNRYSH